MPAQNKRKASKASGKSPSRKKCSARNSSKSSSKATPKETGSPKRSNVNENFLASLITIKCSELKLPNLFTVKREDKVSAVWGKLIEKMIMAAPVVDGDGNFQGFIDTSDIASYLVEKFGEPMLRSNLGAESLTEAMAKELQIWLDKTVGDVMAFDYPTKLRCPPLCYANYSLLSAVEPLAMFKGLHRVAVVESPSSNRLVTVITQSQALQCVFDNINHLGSRKTKPIEDCVDVMKPEGIFVVTKDHIALDAFQHMLRHGVSALAVVVEPKGVTKGVIALRDLQVIGHNGADLWKLYVGVEAFLKFKAVTRVTAILEREFSEAETKAEEDEEDEVKSDSATEGKPEASTETLAAEEKSAKSESSKNMKKGSQKLSSADLLPVTSNVQCKKGDTFASAIKKFVQTGVHRLFVTDENSIPFGVVSIKEVLKELLH